MAFSMNNGYRLNEDGHDGQCAVGFGGLVDVNVERRKQSE